MSGFLGLIAGANNAYKDKQRLQRFQDLELGQKQSAQDLATRVAESQIGENNARTQAILNPTAKAQGPTKWEIAPREDGTYLVNPVTGEAKKINVPGVPRPEKSPSEPNWQAVQTDGGIVQVNPKSGATRPVMGQSGQPLQAPQASSIQQKVASNKVLMTTIDDAIQAVNSHPQSVGATRGWLDLIDQNADPEGVSARALVSNVSSLKVHDRSGGAVAVSEFRRLAPFIPGIHDNAQTVLRKLALLKKGVEEETTLLARSGQSARAAADEQGKPGDITLGTKPPAVSDDEFNAILGKYKK